ncbi:DUF551 domain-containing protein [Agrobacterium burrii]|uniref:DUF551 domain-containing protein n=1 Tax=Agrobacterium burrii TaxID=2815339 RepID=A0ABS3ERH8_9HYPH|nr:DUF551 domain-containing protein [Agrobacterium burrii]MBO0134616.1 hypothetical protein [Agrobacterium burrii]
MGAAENISDLRSLLSIVAEETGALKMDDADEDSVGWTTEGPLPMTFGHVRRAHAALEGLEAALSAAEPVGFFELTEEQGYQQVSKRNVTEPGVIPLYTAPPAPSVAVKALEWNRDAGKPVDLYLVAKSVVGSYRISPMGREGFELRLFGTDPFPIYGSLAEAKAAAQANYEASILSALSAQVQDVLPNVGKWTDEDRAREWRKAFDTMHRRAMNAENAIGAQVQDESEIVDCLSAGKPFVFDPATNFCHADDGGAPENGIKYVPAEQVQDVAGWQSIETAQEGLNNTVLLFNGRRVFEGYWGPSEYDRKQKQWVYAWVSSPRSGDTKPTHWMPLPAAPTKQEE